MFPTPEQNRGNFVSGPTAVSEREALTLSPWAMLFSTACNTQHAVSETALLLKYPQLAVSGKNSRNRE